MNSAETVTENINSTENISPTAHINPIDGEARRGVSGLWRCLSDAAGVADGGAARVAN